jgi:vWA-MoxR associated protein C-terminal domain/vWA-MoxR associated protein middle region 0/Effector-associated domain 2
VREVSAEGSVQRLHGALVDALAGIPLLDSFEARRSLIRIMSRVKRDHFLSIPESPTARAHLVEIVYACLSLPGGLRCLVAALRMLDPAHPGTAEVARIVSSLAVLDVVPPEERRQAHELLDQLPELDIEPLWYAATDDIAPLPARPTETLVGAFDQLIGLNARTDGLPPAIAFVEIAGCRVTGHLAAQLRLWTDGQATRLGLSAELVSLRRSVTANPPPAVAPLPCLVVQIEEHAIRSGCYLLSHWIQHRPGAWNPVRGEVQTVRWADAERAVEALVDRAEEIWGDRPGHVALEFVLPVSLLNEAVDWWRSSAAHMVPLCIDYPVVVRSLERMRDLSRRRVWLNRWTALLRAPSLNAHSALGFTGDLSIWNVQLHRDLEISAVVLSAPPPTSSTDRGHCFWMALTAGVPVILWDRRKDPTDEFLRVTNSLISDPPMNLASRVQELRRQAASNGDAVVDMHPGRHIALLWDDPTRLVDHVPYLDGGGTTWKSGANE